MEKSIKIVSISQDYFNQRAHLTEALDNKLEKRPYIAGMLLDDNQNAYFIPLRTKIPKRELRSRSQYYVHTPSESKPYAGLEIRKMIVINREELVTFYPHTISSRWQYEQIVDKQDELWTKVSDTIEKYKRSILEKKPSLDFRFSTLRYFHNELGLPLEQERLHSQKVEQEVVMEQEPQGERLLSLMKKKLGLTRTSSLKLTENDTIYTAFRKLADYVYKNGEWASTDIHEAAEFMLQEKYPTISFSSIEPWSSEETAAYQGHLKGFAATPHENIVGFTGIHQDTGQKYALVLDATNKSGTKHNMAYRLQGSDHVSYVFGNMSRAIGYHRIYRDLTQFMEQEGIATEIQIGMRALFKDLSYAGNSSKKYQSYFSKSFFGELPQDYLDGLPRDESSQYWGIPEVGDENNPKWGVLAARPDGPERLDLSQSPYLLIDGTSTHFLYPKTLARERFKNLAIDVLTKYMESTYDLVLQAEYDKDIERQSRAGASQTKKQINKETQERMESTPLLERFRFVELDNDVDLKLLDRFEAEMLPLQQVLPGHEKSVDLRLRKLGNYNAMGLYYNHNKTIALDFRDEGISSFVHEYGHFLDYNWADQQLSLSSDFQPILQRYQAGIKRLPTTSYVRQKETYYRTPTEVFARAFELYVSEAGLESSLLKRKGDYASLDEYVLFHEDTKELLEGYFGKLFPELKGQIENYQKQQLEQPQEVKKALSFKEQKAIAKSRDILDVANQLGMDLKRVGHDRYKWEEHGGFVFTPSKNLWNWFAGGKGGDVIQLVQHHLNVDFKQAVSYLASGTFQQHQAVEVNEKPFSYYLERHEKRDFKEAREYLKNERGLSDETIDFFGQKGVLAQATKKTYLNQEGSIQNDFFYEPVVVFKTLNKDGRVVGASLQGIEVHEGVHERGRLKQILRASETMNGMHVDIGTPERLVVAESPIDLMSYYELHKDTLQNVRLLAMDGMKDSTISRHAAEIYGIRHGQTDFEVTPQTEKFLEVLANMTDFFKDGQNQDFITLAIDFDEAAFNFKLRLMEKGIPFQSDVPIELGVEKMDWNEYLKKSKEKRRKEVERMQEQAVIAADLQEAQTMPSDGQNLSVEDEPISSLTSVELASQTQELTQAVQEKILAGDLKLSLSDDMYSYSLVRYTGWSDPYNQLPPKALAILNQHRSFFEGISEANIEAYKTKGSPEQNAMYELLQGIQKDINFPPISTVFSQEIAISAYNLNRMQRSLSQSEWGVSSYAPLSQFGRDMWNIAEYPYHQLEDTTDYDYALIPYHLLKELNRQEGQVEVTKEMLDKVIKEAAHTKVKEVSQETKQPPKILPRDLSRLKPSELGQVATQTMSEIVKNSAAMSEYVDLMTRHAQLSPTNIALIQAQWSNAQAVATFKQWQALEKVMGITSEDLIASTQTFTNKRTGETNTISRTGLSVRAGEKSRITLMKPIVQEVIPVLDDKGSVVLNEAGQSQFKPMKQATLQEKRLLESGQLKSRSIPVRDEAGNPMFDTYKVFEQSQTTLKPEAYSKIMPTRSVDFEQELNKRQAVDKALEQSAETFQVSLYWDDKNVLDDKNSQYLSQERAIVLKPGLTETERIYETIKGLSQAAVDNPTQPKQPYQEMEGEAISYLLSKRYGLPLSDQHKDGLETWRKQLMNLDEKELVGSMERVHRAFSHVSRTIDQESKLYQRARGRDLHQVKGQEFMRPSGPSMSL